MPKRSGSDGMSPSFFNETVGADDNEPEDENLAMVRRRSIELFARNLNIDLPKLPDTSHRCRCKSGTRSLKELRPAIVDIRPIRFRS